MARLALETWHQERGGRIRTLHGREVVWDYRQASPAPAPAPAPSADGAVSAPLRLALADRSGCGRLELVGADRVRFLGGLVTCDVGQLRPGQAAYGYFTDPKGRILSDVLVVALSDRLWLELPSSEKAAQVRTHVEKYIVADRVEVLPLGDFVQLVLAGPELAAALQRVFGASTEEPTGAAAPAVGDAGVVMLGKTQLFAHWHPRLGMPAAQFWVSSGIALEVAEDLLVACDAELCGHEALERARLVAGVPLYDADFDSSNLPGEVAVEGAVDFDKGCYLGQEVVARMHYRGQPARQLRRLGFGDSAAAAHVLTAGEHGLWAGGEEVGRVTSWIAGAAPGLLHALALLHRRALEAESLHIGSGAEAPRAEILGPPPALPGGSAVAETVR